MGITRILPRTHGMSTSELIRRVCRYNEEKLRDEGLLKEKEKKEKEEKEEEKEKEKEEKEEEKEEKEEEKEKEKEKVEEKVEEKKEEGKGGKNKKKKLQRLNSKN